VALDAGVLFASVGQIFGRIGNLVNGDIIGYPSTLPWSTIYQHPASWACLNRATCNVPVQPAAAYELLTNLTKLALLVLLFSLALYLVTLGSPVAGLPVRLRGDAVSPLLRPQQRRCQLSRVELGAEAGAVDLYHSVPVPAPCYITGVSFLAASAGW
jgi:Prolipoprotein diacylglyceryl transferase